MLAPIMSNGINLAIIATADTPVLRNTYVTLRGRYARTRHHSETGAIADSHYSKGDWLTQRTFSDAGRYGVIVEWIRRLAPQGPVLDIGAGDGLLSDALSPDVDYLGVDYAPATIDATPNGWPNAWRGQIRAWSRCGAQKIWSLPASRRKRRSYW